MNDIVFFTCANKAYEHFAPVYAASVLSHLDTARIELGLEDAEAFRRRSGALALLEEAFPGRVLVRDVPWTWEGRRIAPNSVRFMQEPVTRATWTYIGDIDIIFLDPLFFDRHLPFMARTGLPYSNSLRPGTNRLSGLHLVRSDAWYPLPGFDGLEPNHDEVLLHDICLRKGLPIQDAEWFRPVHGIHVSPNREVAGWHVPPWRKGYHRLASTELFKALRPRLDDAMEALLRQVDEEVARPAVFQRIRQGAAEGPSLKDTPEYRVLRDERLKEKDYQGAAELGVRFLRTWPNHAVVHHQTAWSLAALHLYPEAAEHEKRAVELAPGRADFRAFLEKLQASAGDVPPA